MFLNLNLNRSLHARHVTQIMADTLVDIQNLHKRFPITERVNFEFRTEIYNIFNRANFANPSARLNNSLGVGVNKLQPGDAYTAAAAGGSFGLMNTTVTKDVGLGASRQLQLSLRLNF